MVRAGASAATAWSVCRIIGDAVEHLGKRGFHARPLPGGKDQDGEAGIGHGTMAIRLKVATTTDGYGDGVKTVITTYRQPVKIYE